MLEEHREIPMKRRKLKTALVFAAAFLVEALAFAALCLLWFRPVVPVEEWRLAFVYAGDKALKAELYKPLWRKQPIFLHIIGDGVAPLYGGNPPGADGSERWFALSISTDGKSTKVSDLPDGLLRKHPYLYLDPRTKNFGAYITDGKVDAGWEKSMCMGFSDFMNEALKIEAHVNMRYIAEHL